MITLVDSNVILDLVTDDRQWFEWSAESLSQAGDESTLAINPIIYAEVSVGFRTIEEIETLLPVADFRRLALPYEAASLPAKRSWPTAAAAEGEPHHFLTFTSVRTPRSPDSAF